MDNKEHIDKQLEDILSNASMDAPGIEWDAFQAKRKKRRAALWWFVVPGLLLIGGLAWFFMPNREKESTKEISLFANDSIKTAGASWMKLQQHEDSRQQTLRQMPLNQVNPNKISGMSPLMLQRHMGKQHQTEEGKSENIMANQLVRDPMKLISDQHQLWDAETKEWRFRDDMGEIMYKPHPSPLRKFPLNIQDNMDYAELDIPSVKTKTARNKFFLQAQAGPSMNFPRFRVTGTGQAFIHKEYGSTRSSSETGLPGYGLQVMLGMTQKRLDLSFGIGLSNTMVSGRYDFLYSERPIINTDGTVAYYVPGTPSQVRFNSRQNYTFVEFPIHMDYKLYMKNRWSISAHGGVSNQFLQNISGELPNALFMDLKDVLNAENFKTYSAGFELGSRLAYHQGRKLQFALMPLYRKNLGFYQVKSYYKNTFDAFAIQFSVRAHL